MSLVATRTCRVENRYHFRCRGVGVRTIRISYDADMIA